MARCEQCLSEKVCRYNDGINLYCKEDYECPHFKNTADVVEVKHGEWIVIGKTVGWSNILQCSVCGRVRKGVGKSAFCRDCGAKMDVSKKEITTGRIDSECS